MAGAARERAFSDPRGRGDRNCRISIRYDGFARVILLTAERSDGRIERREVGFTGSMDDRDRHSRLPSSCILDRFNLWRALVFLRAIKL